MENTKKINKKQQNEFSLLFTDKSDTIDLKR